MSADERSEFAKVVDARKAARARAAELADRKSVV